MFGWLNRNRKEVEPFAVPFDPIRTTLSKDAVPSEYRATFAYLGHDVIPVDHEQRIGLALHKFSFMAYDFVAFASKQDAEPGINDDSRIHIVINHAIPNFHITTHDANVINLASSGLVYFMVNDRGATIARSSFICPDVDDSLVTRMIIMHCQEIIRSCKDLPEILEGLPKEGLLASAARKIQDTAGGALAVGAVWIASMLGDGPSE